MLENKYNKTYYSIISRAQSRTKLDVPIEKHHIVPKSIGGSNDKSNLVSLTLREHFICHKLLIKITSGKNRNKMVYALWKMCHSTKSRKTAFKLTARTYEAVKILMRNVRTSDDFTPEWRAKISASRKGKSSWNKGVARTTEERAKISATRKQKSSNPTWNIRPPCTAEKAQKIRLANLNKKKLYNPTTNERATLNPAQVDSYLNAGWVLGQGPRKAVVKKKCPHCSKLVDPGNYVKLHGDNCKVKLLLFP